MDDMTTAGAEMVGRQLGVWALIGQRCLLAAALLWPAISASAQADTLILQGSTTFSRRLMETHQAAIEAASGHELTVIPNKSTPGLIALMEGRAHMAMISAPLANEIEVLKKAMPGLAFDRLHVFPIVSTRIALAVHRSNPVRKLPLQDIERVLSGAVKNWNALGWRDQPIRIVLVGGGGGVTTVIESELLAGKPVSVPNVIYVKTPVQLVQVVEQEPGALGFAQLALLKQRELPELVTDKAVEQVLSLVTLGGPTPAMQSVIDAARSIAEKQM
jgi:phosphate transport system substrate-binding protein